MPRTGVTVLQETGRKDEDTQALRFNSPLSSFPWLLELGSEWLGYLILQRPGDGLPPCQAR